MRIMRLQDLRNITVEENGEQMVDLAREVPTILCDYRRTDSHFHAILVRKTLANKLYNVQERLAIEDPSLKLIVTEGYRHPFYQEQYYLQQFLNLGREQPHLSCEALQELTHQFVALPSVAGHPTGGAVDVSISRHGKEIDMGGAIADFSQPEKLSAFSPCIQEEQTKNRRLLHDVMIKEGFAPFYGEWWHFSYGDREWAAFYYQTKALYASVNLSFKCIDNN